MCCGSLHWKLETTAEEKFSNKTQSPDSTVFHQKHSLQELESIGLLINMSLNLSRNRKVLKKAIVSK